MFDHVCMMEIQVYLKHPSYKWKMVLQLAPGVQGVSVYVVRQFMGGVQAIGVQRGILQLVYALCCKQEKLCKYCLSVYK